jgi:hypothetical protein
MCTVEELLKEKEYRQKMLQDEIKRKGKKTTPLLIIGVVCVAFTFVLTYFFKDTFNATISAFTVLGGLSAYGSLVLADKTHTNKTDFQERQEQTIKEIKNLIREKSFEH